MPQSSDFFAYFIDCQRAFEGEDLEDRVIKFGFSTFENWEFSSLPLSLRHTLIALARWRKIGVEVAIHFFRQVFVLETPRWNVSAGRNAYSDKFLAGSYLSGFCVFVLRFSCVKVFWACFFGGVFGVPKHFAGSTWWLANLLLWLLACLGLVLGRV